MSRRLAFPAIIPMRNVTDEKLAARARASLPLQARRRLADCSGMTPWTQSPAGVRHTRSGMRAP
jgi:hypothetical protein